MHFRNALFLGLLAVREHRQESAIPTAAREGCCQICCTAVPGGQAGGGLSPSDPLQIPKSTHCWLAFPTIGAGNSPDSRRAPGHSMHGPREGREATGPPGPSTLLPCSWFWLRLSLQALLLNQNFHQHMQVTRDFSKSLTAWPSILRLQVFFPQVYICTKTTTRFKLQQLMKFNYINRERAF